MFREIYRTASGKLFLGVWGLSVFIVAGFILAGFFILDGEIAGGILISTLISGELTVISIIVSFWAGAKSYSLARITWLCLALLALISTLMLSNAGERDADIALVYAILILTFPLGLFACIMVGPAVSSFGSLSIFIFWGVVVVVGYAQWFVLVPMFIKQIRKQM